MTETLHFPKALAAFGRDEFEGILKQEIESLGARHLPLAAALTGTNQVADDRIQVMVIAVTDGDDCVRVRTGIFFSGILTGCSCADDPTPVAEQNEYGEFLFEIDKATAQATVTPLP